MDNKLNITILNSTGGTFDINKALMFGGHAAGVCYNKEGYNKVFCEDSNATQRRIDRTLDSQHLSVYGHTQITFNMENVPKIVAMILNNEKAYNTSEKSARYTPIIDSSEEISLKEIELYNKWILILRAKITEKYGKHFSAAEIEKLAMENARYFVTVFMPTQMIYTVSFRQINHIIALMKEYIEKENNNPFTEKVKRHLQEFITAIEKTGVCDARLQCNNKNMNLSLFGDNLEKSDEFFGDVYTTIYQGSFAQVAQVQRHRTLDYQIELTEQKRFYIPPIIQGDPLLVQEWISDMETVQDYYPQGQLVTVRERGTFENFILKLYERLCSHTQLETMQQTRATLLRYKDELEKRDHYLKNYIDKYMRGAPCTFPGYLCKHDCKFKEGKILTRVI